SYYFEYLWFIKDRNSITEGKAYENIGNLYLNKGLFDHAIHYFFKSQDIFDKLQSFENKARVIHILGIIFLNRGDHEIAQEYFQNAKDLSSKIGDDKGIGWSILHLGLLEFKMGDLSSALVLLNQCFNLFRNIDDKLMMAWSLRSIGDIHRVKGEFEKALNYYEKDIQELEGFDNSWILADTYNKIGQIYFKKGMIDLAIENYQISTSLYLKLGDWLSASDPVFNLIIVKLDLKLFNHATDLLNFLESLKNRSNDKIVKLRYTIAKALILKNNTRIIQKVKAQEMLTQITNEEIIDHELTVICMINLCELLLHELRTYQQDEVLSDIINLSTKLLLIAQDQKSYWLLVEVLILKAKLALIEGNAEEALNLLNSADEIVDARNLEQQKFKINIEQDNLQVTLEIWKELTSVNASIRERMDLSGIEDYIEKIFNQ
ncbi:MAG: tetratricopeptide repeat protein, partial [Candidatus Heimdallarchaeota archaeon]|nr:tetratricopeptide repeat protein [Candidatus Heimdallarchaeota archaeon]